jgi:hypothetical protein
MDVWGGSGFVGRPEVRAGIIFVGYFQHLSYSDGYLKLFTQALVLNVFDPGKYSKNPSLFR